MAKSFYGSESPLPSPKSERSGGVDFSVPKTPSKAVSKGPNDTMAPSKYEPSASAKNAPSSNKPEKQTSSSTFSK